MEMDNIFKPVVLFFWVQHIDHIQFQFGFINHHQQLETEHSFISQLCKKNTKLSKETNSLLRNKNNYKHSLLS
jgi:hypothetical protein